MQCEDARLILTDMIYGEDSQEPLSPDFKDHFSQCSQCSADYLDLVEARKCLASWEDEEAPSRLVFIKPGTTRLSSFHLPVFSWFRPALAYATLVLILVCGLILARVQFVWGDGRIALQSAWFSAPAVVPSVSFPSTSASNQDIAASLEKFMSIAEARQNQQTLSLLQRAMETMEYQRQMDLARLREELGSLQQTYYQTIERNSFQLEQNARFMRQSKY